MTDAVGQAWSTLLPGQPDQGVVMKGTGGFRKVQVAAEGKGKSGSYRVIWFFSSPSIPVFPITVFAKNATETDTGRTQCPGENGQNPCRYLCANGEGQERTETMSKSAFDKIAAGMGDALANAAGEADVAQFNVRIPAQVDVKKIRGRLKMTKPVLAKKFGFSLAVSAIGSRAVARSKPDHVCC